MFGTNRDRKVVEFVFLDTIKGRRSDAGHVVVEWSRFDVALHCCVAIRESCENVRDQRRAIAYRPAGRAAKPQLSHMPLDRKRAETKAIEGKLSPAPGSRLNSRVES